MNPICEIGRYNLPLGSVTAIRKRQFDGWRKILLRLRLAQPGYDAILNNGQIIHFTEEEKEKYDTAIEWHSIVVQWYGAARGMGLRT